MRRWRTKRCKKWENISKDTIKFGISSSIETFNTLDIHHSVYKIGIVRAIVWTQWIRTHLYNLVLTISDSNCQQSFIILYQCCLKCTKLISGVFSALVNPRNIFLLLFHINLDLMKRCVKEKKKEGTRLK